MDTFKNTDEILDFAIKREEEARQFYTELAEKVEHPEMKKVFEDFAKEEQGHKKKLELVKKGEYRIPEIKDIMDMKIADYVVDAEVQPNLEYQDALILAMKKEKASFKLYNDLSKATDNLEVSTLFLLLAKEEARHKLRFEIEYDEYYLPEN
ncbi:MAG: ferritin family protein [Spirochaetales bacterium]|nr:ferritin family protein [Spirochaetales bacterium]